MGVVTTTRALPSSTKIRRGIGLVLVGILGWIVCAVLVVALDGAFGPNNPLGWALLVVALLATAVAVVCALVGLVLLIWGLLQD